MKQSEKDTHKIRLKAYSTKEVAHMYEISGKTLKKWLNPFQKEIGQRTGHFYNPKQMKVIFNKLGLPGVIYVN